MSETALPANKPPDSAAAGRWRVRRWSAVIAAVEVILLVVAITGGVVVVSQLGTARSRVVDQLDPQLLAARDLYAALLNQETGLRGYQLTGQASFRDPYDEGRRQQDQAVAELHRLGATGDTPAGRDLDDVLAKADAWQRTAQAQLAAPVPSPAEVDRAKAQFDSVRAALDTQRRNLGAARDADRANLSHAATFLSVMLFVIAVLVLGLFIGVYALFHRAIARPILRLAGEVRHVTAGELHRPVRSRGGPRELAELADDVEAMRGRLVDEVTELHRAHELLDARTAELERSNSDLEQFAYVASHDLQEPLRKVASFCQLLQRRYQGRLDERGEKYIAFAVDGAKRMQVLINDLLAFSRVGRNAGEHEVVDTGELLDAATSNLESAIKYSGATIRHGELPKVLGEASLLTAVFQNLISNAIKFRGEDPPDVRVEAVRSGGEWLFSFTDKGIGIDAEYAERVFVIFQRLHTRSAYPGTGIGLAMCRKIIEYHGGRIWLDTGTSDGTTRFSFTLPVIAEQAAGEESEDA